MKQFEFIPGRGINITADPTARAITFEAEDGGILIDLASSEPANIDGTEGTRPGVSGVLPVAHGGTGAETRAGARESLGISEVPKGGIIMWSGAVGAIPAGWALCTGQNGTPNLLDRFVCGIRNANTDPGETGGANTKSIAVANLPVHSHELSGSVTTSDGEHSHTTTCFNMGTADDGGGVGFGRHYVARATSAAGAHSHGLSGTVGDTGGGEAFDVRPAWYALAYIMKL